MKFSEILDKYWATKPVIAHVGFKPSALSLKFRTAAVIQKQTHKIYGEKDKRGRAIERALAGFFPLSCPYFSNLTLKIVTELLKEKESNYIQ